MKPLPIGPFLGVNNRLPPFALHKPKVGDYVRDAVNVDFTDGGSIRRRRAASLVQAVSGAHSLFGDLVVIGSAIYRITLPSYTQTLVKSLTSNAPMAWLQMNGDTYYSNGTDSGRIDAAGAVYPWGLPLPGEPAVSAIAGSLAAGYYQVAVAHARYAGGTGVANLLEEGGVGPSQNFNLSAGGGMRVSLPAAVAGSTHLNIYVSTQNGSIPMLYSVVAAGTSTVDITALPTGRDAIQRYEEPLPAGTQLLEYNGRLCSVKGNDLFYGLPYRPGYYSPVQGRISLPKAVAVAVANQSGIYLATTISATDDGKKTDRTYFVAGADLDSTDVLVRDVLPYGAVHGTAFELPNKENIIVGWFGLKGVVLADSQGSVTQAMVDTVDQDPPAYGFATVFEEGGMRHVVSCGWSLNVATLAAGRYVGWDFTSISGKYGTMAGGIYTIGDGGMVDAYADFGRLDFGMENEKRLIAVYAGVASSSAMKLDIGTPDGESYSYSARSSSDDLNIHRFDPGKGLRANWFDCILRNTDGCDFTLASLSFAPAASSRRI